MASNNPSTNDGQVESILNHLEALAASLPEADRLLFTGDLQRLRALLEFQGQNPNKDHQTVEQSRPPRDSDPPSAYQRAGEILESITDACYAVDAGWRLVYVNKRTEQLWQKPRDSLVGKMLWELFPNQEQNKGYQALHRAMETRTSEYFENFSPYLKTWVATSIYPSSDGGLCVYFQDVTERKLAEEALRESEERYRALFSNMTEGFALHEVIYDEQGKPVDYRLLDANPAFERLTGTRREAVIGKSVREALPRMGEEWISAYAQVALTGEPAHFERYNVDLDRFYEVFAYRPGSRQFAIVFMDITERKSAEQALQESEQRFRLALRNAPVSIAAQDRDLRYIWAYNQRSAQPDQIIGRFDHEIFNAEEAAYITSIKQRVLEEGIEQREQMWLDRPAGRMYLDICWEPILDNTGNIVGVASATVDLTPIKLAEGVVRESEARLQLALDAARMVAWEYDPVTLKVTFSANAEKVLELPRKIENSDQGYNLIHPADVEHHRALVTSAIATGGSYASVYRHAHAEQVIWLEEHGRAVVDQSGKTIRLVGVVQNITARKQAEEAHREHMVQIELHRRLLEYREQERQMIARDLHDGPIQDLSGMLFNIQFAKEAITDLLIKVELEKLALGLKATVQNLREMINEMRPPSLIRFGLSRAIQIYLEEFGEKHPKIGIDASLIEDGDHFTEQARLGLYRILQEALTNAIKHAKASHIAVELIQDSRKAVLEIHDDGKGFAAPASLMDYGAQGHYGLVGMKERAEAIGGVFELQSYPGNGTTIRVTVPVR